jgi:protein-L-isoaspartate(D-aspartate) O-methyltransferase
MGMNYTAAREKMVDTQVRPNDVTQYDVLGRFLTVPREAFVPESMQALAYIDDDILLPCSNGGDSRWVMNAMTMSKLVQLADPQQGELVLDLGCASGYSSAIMSGLCESVVAVENRVDLQEQAQETLVDLGCDNVAVISGPLIDGCPSEAPYDVIFVGGAIETIPDTILKQMKDGGRLVCVEGYGNSGQGTKYIRTGDSFSKDHVFNGCAKPLAGFERKQEFVF